MADYDDVPPQVVHPHGKPLNKVADFLDAGLHKAGRGSLRAAHYGADGIDVGVHKTVDATEKVTGHGNASSKHKRQFVMKPDTNPGF